MTSPILSHTYENGLVLVAQPMQWLQSAAFSFLVPAGCVHEPHGRSGLGSFACEMTLRGAGPRDNHQFVLDLDNLGVEHHASVSSARMSYGGAMLGENLPAALTIFADVLRRPRLPEEELEACRQTMLQGLRAVEDEPSEKTMIELRRRFYPDPWGRPSLGEQEALEAIELDDIRNFVRRQFQPQGTILGVAGQVQWEPLKDLVGQLFGDWQPAGGAAFTERAAQGGYLHVPYDSAQTHIGVAYASVPYRHEDYFRAWGAVGALGGGMSSRLFTEVREKRGLCYSVYSSYHTLLDRAGVFCYAGSSAQRAQETLDVTLAELRRLADGIEPAELDRLKARIKTELVMQQESSFSRGSSIAREWYHLHRARTLEELQGIIDGLTCADINDYLAANPPEKFTIVTVGPEALTAPLSLRERGRG